MEKCLFYDYLYGKCFKAALADIRRAENVGYALAMSKLKNRKMLSDDDVTSIINGIYRELAIKHPKSPLWYESFKDNLPFSVLQIFALISSEEQ